MRDTWRWMLVLGLLPMAMGCPSKTVIDNNTEIVDMEPIFIVVSDKDGEEGTGFDSQELFDKALRAYEERRIDQALPLFQMLAEESIGPENKATGYTYVALCQLALRNVGSALEALDKAEPLVQNLDDKRQISLVRMQALAESGKWEEVKELGKPLIGTEIQGAVRAQALLMLGLAYKVEADYVTSLDYLEKSAVAFMSEVPFEKQFKNRGLAQAQNKIGDIYRILMDKIRLHMPVERMQLDIHDKLAIYRRAETAYQDAARVRDPYWSPRAGYEMGQLKEAYAMDILAAERPADLTADEAVEYQAALNEKVVEYLEVAKIIYEETVKMVDMYGFPDEFKLLSRQRIEAIDQQIKGLARAE